MLLLFDIDGTLLGRATKAHRDSLYAALREVHGVEVSDLRPQESLAGRTDGEIARMLLVLAGIPAKQIDDHADDVREVCCREYARRCPYDLSHTVLPGVRELLEALSASAARPRLALLTGNYEPVARLKLKKAGIGRYFHTGQGAFGSDSEDRTDLPAIARLRAGEEGEPYPRAETIVIGDTPLDIACARADGLRAVGVASGPYGPEELGEADAVAADASELLGLLDAGASAGAGAGTS